jgi:hypothetical protein
VVVRCWSNINKASARQPDLLNLTFRRFLFWKERLVFFPTQRFIQGIAQDWTGSNILRISQSTYPLPACPGLVRQKIALTTCVDLTKSPDAIFAGMHPRACRYRIRQIEKLGDRVQVRRNDPIVYADFLTLYNRFVKLKGYARPLSHSRFACFLGHADVFVLYLDQIAHCGHLLFRDDQTRRVRGFFSATRRLEGREDAILCGALNRFLHWHEMRTYQAERIELYDLGGIEDGTTSIAQFKLEFGGFQLSEYCATYMDQKATAAYSMYSGMLRLRPKGVKRRSIVA